MNSQTMACMRLCLLLCGLLVYAFCADAALPGVSEAAKKNSEIKAKQSGLQGTSDSEDQDSIAQLEKEISGLEDDIQELESDLRKKKPEQRYFERSFVDGQTLDTRDKERLFRDFGIIEADTEKEDEKEDDSGDEGQVEPEEPSDDTAGLDPATKTFNDALNLLSKTEDKKNTMRAYGLFQEAWKLNHTEAGGIVAFAHLFGVYFKQNIAYASGLFVNLSKLGEPRAQGGMGIMYTLGVSGFNTSQAKALIYYTFGALGGNPLSMMSLAYKYWQGVGVPQSCEGALIWYRKVADRVAEDVSAASHVITRVRLQDQFENPNFFATLLDQDLIQYFQFIAEKGDTKAQIGLGQLHYQGGRGVNVDHRVALSYFNHAADKGNANAQAYVGKMHAEGGSNHVKQNYDLAYSYFKKSADQNNPMGQAGLGQLYLEGHGVKKNYVEARRLFQLAADQANVDGQLNLGVIYFLGMGVSKDYKKAVKYFNLASQNGHTLAFYYLAQMQESGLGMLRSCPMAVELYKNVAERGRWSEMFMEAHDAYMLGKRDEAFMMYSALAEMGYEVAQSNVAFMLERRETLLIDQSIHSPRALMYWERSAAQGYHQARVKVGDYHYYGKGTDVSYEEAVVNYRQASEQYQNAQAMFNLAYMHELGLGMKQDIHLAKRFYDMAAETSHDAQLPVLLALLKMAALYGLEPFYNENNKEQFQAYFAIDYWLGESWDIYAITFLTLVFSLLTFFILQNRRRPRR